MANIGTGKDIMHSGLRPSGRAWVITNTNCLAFLFRMPCYKADVCVFYEEKAGNTKCPYCDLWTILRGKTGNNASEGG